jgi:hypothetical protein
MFASDGGAQRTATVSLDTFTVEAARAVILIFSLWIYFLNYAYRVK